MIPSEWSKHVANEFVAYASGWAPIAKSVRIATIERQKESDVTVRVGPCRPCGLRSMATAR